MKLKIIETSLDEILFESPYVVDFNLEIGSTFEFKTKRYTVKSVFRKLYVDSFENTNLSVDTLIYYVVIF